MKSIINFLEIVKKLIEIIILCMFAYGLYWFAANKSNLIQIFFGE